MKLQIADVYKRNQKMMELIGQIIENVQKQNYYNATLKQKELVISLSEWMRNLTKELAYFGEDVAGLQEDNFGSFLHILLDAQEQKDFILYADILQTQLLPFLKDLQQVIYEKEGIMIPDYRIEKTQQFLKNMETLFEVLEKIPMPDEEEYQVVPAMTGALTFCIREGDKSFFLHSSVDPILEAENVASEYFDCDCEHYIVYGLGLGYHIAALNKRCLQAAKIDVYESDLNVIKLASVYGLPEEMLTDNVVIHHDLDCSEIAKSMQEDKSVLFLHYPSVRNIRNQEIYKSFDKFIVKESTIRNNKDRMYINFKQNCENCDKYVDELQKQFEGKHVYLVAAGPSLDKNVELLKKKRKTDIILSVGTTYHKLMNLGIKPDYVIFLDAGERTYKQIEGLEQEKIPLLIGSTAYYQIAKKYQGDSYLVCQEGYAPAEFLADENHFNLYQTGGSVSTVAMDVAIRLGASKLVCVGLDLAYTDQMSHAADTMDTEPCSMQDGYSVKDFNGGMVMTSNLFTVYREWIEKRIAREENCCFINATEGGAFIEGMQHMTLKEAMSKREKPSA